MVTVRNLVNSPYDIRVVGGKTVRLPPLGSIDVEIDPTELPHYKVIPYFEIEEATEDDLDALRQKYEAQTGEAPDKRWGAKRLKEALRS